MTLDIPEAVVHALRLPRNAIKEELKRILSVALYAKGILGFGKARDLAGVSKLEFYAFLRRERVPLNYMIEDAQGDLQTIRELRC